MHPASRRTSWVKPDSMDGDQDDGIDAGNGGANEWAQLKDPKSGQTVRWTTVCFHLSLTNFAMLAPSTTCTRQAEKQAG